MVAMVDPATALPADNIDGDLTPGSRSAYTSPTNIGGYLWSAVVARELGIISAREARTRVSQTLDTLAGSPAGPAVGGDPVRTGGAVLASVLVTAAAGLGFSWLRFRGDSVVAPAVVHAALNSSAFVAARLAAR